MKLERLKRNHAVRKIYGLCVPLILYFKTYAAQLKRAVIGTNVEALLVSSRQGLFLVAPEDRGVGEALVRCGQYGQDEIQRICDLSDENTTVLFVGTHIGALAIPVSKRVKHVTAIEANPNTFTLLKRNILLNQCANISAVQLAANDQAGELEFILSRVNSGGSKRMPVKKAYNYFYDRPQAIKVKADRLDVVVPERRDIIVMDIEGSEYFALKGMERLLSEAHHLIVEFMPHHLRGVANISVEQFLEPIKPHFERLTIPSKGVTLNRSQFVVVLEQMYESGEADDGIVFSKEPE